MHYLPPTNNDNLLHNDSMFVGIKPRIGGAKLLIESHGRHKGGLLLKRALRASFQGLGLGAGGLIRLAPSEAALLPFRSGKGIHSFQIFGVYDGYMREAPGSCGVPSKPSDI